MDSVSDPDSDSDSDSDSDPDAMTRFYLDNRDGSESDSDSEPDSDSDPDPDPDDKISGGAATKYPAKKLMKNPNPFLKRLQDMDEGVKNFNKEAKRNSTNGYSIKCPHTDRRQPIILTQDEYEKNLDNYNISSVNGQKSFQNAFKNSFKNKDYWYICPRYWAMKENLSLTEEQAKSGKFGKIIPQDAKTIKEGENIFELASKKYHFDKSGNYNPAVPGFHKDSEPGACIPCCFKKVVSEKQKQLRNKCLGETNDVKETNANTNYTQNHLKVPIPNDSEGYLQPALLNLLGLDITNSGCGDKKNECFLRKGVESNNKQSFVGCLSKIQGETNKEMKNNILGKITLDVYIALQNGSLVDTFDDMSNVDVNEYSNTNLYNFTNKSNIEEMYFLTKAARSFNNFQKFLQDDDDEHVIDHTYLWDYVTSKNMYTETGVNLVLLNYDYNYEDRVNIVCPTNHYAENSFDRSKKTIIILMQLAKNGNTYYEPIIEVKGKKTKGNFLFDVNDKKLNKNINKMILNIERLVNNACSAEGVTLEGYDYERNISVTTLTNIISDTDYSVTRHVMSYDGKIVGITVKARDNKEIFIPCLPSAPTMFYNTSKGLSTATIWIGNLEYQSYDTTVQLLTEINNIDEKIKCKPVMKVVDKGLIVGITTETNQFVEISPKIDDKEATDYGFGVLSEDNNNLIDSTIMTGTQPNTERLENTRNIKLDAKFYNLFRTTVRIILGKDENKKVRQDLREIIDSDLRYMDKLTKVNGILTSDSEDGGVMSNYVKFVDYDIDVLEDLSICVNTNASCRNKETMICPTARVEGECLLLIPKTNILNNRDNEDMYYGRISDELIRYHNLSSFIMNENNTIINFTDVDYDLKENETILLESEITQEYFKNLVLKPRNKYTHNETFDNVLHNLYSYETVRNNTKTISFDDYNINL